jgi:hypothetical protein
MKVLLIAESHIGTHYSAVAQLVKEGVEVELLSLQGSRGIKFKNKGYSVSVSIKNYAKRFDIVLLGTDLDLQGTKIASVLKYQLPVKSVRVAFSEKGYVRIGEVFPKDRLGKVLALDRNHMLFAKKVTRSVGVGGIGLGKAFAIRRTALISGQEFVRIESKGTSTITVLTKFQLKGYSAERGMRVLESLYHSSFIDYPRVDNDYITEKPYDLYPHKPIRWQGEFFEPFQEDFLPLSDKTILLELSNRRLITPANSLSTLITLRKIFTPQLKPRKKYRKLVEFVLSELSDEDEQTYIQNLSDIFFPQLWLSPPLKPTKKLLEKLLGIEETQNIVSLARDEIAEDENLKNFPENAIKGIKTQEEVERWQKQKKPNLRRSFKAG